MTPLIALILPLLLADAAPPRPLPEPRQGTAARSDSMRTHVTKGFELYGPTDDDLSGANNEVGNAVSQFALYLGQSPKKMAFVLFRSAAEADRYDYSPLTKRGLEVLAWVITPEAQWPRVPGAGDPRLTQDGDSDNPDPLSHEAGHRFLDAYLDDAVARARASGPFATDSGGPGAAPIAPGARHPDHRLTPDWLEEAVAALCEPPSLQRRRIEFMRAHLERRIPFPELFTMRRPPAGTPGSPRGGASRNSPAGSAAPAGTARASATQRAAARAARAAIFTAEALSLIRFIADREEDRFVGTIVEGVTRGRTVGDVLNTAHTLYSKPEALETQWLEWMNPSRTP